MSLVNTDKPDENLVQSLRGLLIDEISATRAYESLILACEDSRIRAILEEIQKDEENHQGRLFALIMELAPDMEEPFKKGTEQKE